MFSSFFTVTWRFHRKWERENYWFIHSNKIFKTIWINRWTFNFLFKTCRHGTYGNLKKNGIFSRLKIIVKSKTKNLVNWHSPSNFAENCIVSNSTIHRWKISQGKKCKYLMKKKNCNFRFKSMCCNNDKWVICDLKCITL